MPVFKEAPGFSRGEHVSDDVNHPPHYGGDTTYETIKVIEAWGLGFCLGNCVKYISRAGKKNKDAEIEDLKKALWYLQREIDTKILERAREQSLQSQ